MRSLLQHSLLVLSRTWEMGYRNCDRVVYTTTTGIQYLDLSYQVTWECGMLVFRPPDGFQAFWVTLPAHQGHKPEKP